MGRTGSAIPLKETLQLMQDHANARDAVYTLLDVTKLTEELGMFLLPIFKLQSRAESRLQYLQRPDLGRLLSISSGELLQQNEHQTTCDIVIIVADGLSATAVQNHTLPVLRQLMPLLQKYIIRFCTVEQGRVAIGDEVGKLLNARFSLVLIGERPGLSAHDSMSAYLTYNPQPGLTDESRNCVSNIRPQGLGYKEAAFKINYLIQQAFQLNISGVFLKDGYIAQKQL